MTTFVAFGNLERPFNRMVDAVRIAFSALPKPVVIQGGANVDRFADEQSGVRVFKTCPLDEFSSYFKAATLVITHGGVGAISEALAWGHRPAVFVRQAALKEHIDDHQGDWCTLLFERDLAALVRDGRELLTFTREGRFRQRDIAAAQRFIDHAPMRSAVQAYIRSELNKRR